MQEMKDMMLQQNETILQREIARANGERPTIESSLQQLSISGSTQSSEESERSRQELRQEIQYQQSSNRTLQKMCEEALSKTGCERTGQKIKDVKATYDSAALAGIINPPENKELKIDQEISGVTADHRSVATAGVIWGLGLAKLPPTAPSNHMGYGGQ